MAAGCGWLVTLFGSAVSLLAWVILAWLGVWYWVERLSWLVIVLGFPAAIVQLWLVIAEQRRISRELTRQPVVEVFFEPGADPGAKPPVFPKTCEIHPVWRRNQPLSDPVELHILVLNRGDRTEREVFLNLTIPPGIDAELGERDIGTLHMQTLRDPAGNLRYIAEQAFMHPGVLMILIAPVRIPKGGTGFPLVVAINVSDKRTAITNLAVTVV